MSPRYIVTLSAHGGTHTEVEAATPEEAGDRALEATVGFLVEHGSVDWEVDSVEELEQDDGEASR